MLKEDFGSVYTDVAKSFGVVKDDQSPYVFNIASSVFMNPELSQQLTEMFSSECGYLTGLISSGDLLLLFREDSTVGAGEMYERLAT